MVVSNDPYWLVKRYHHLWTTPYCDHAVAYHNQNSNILAYITTKTITISNIINNHWYYYQILRWYG